MLNIVANRLPGAVARFAVGNALAAKQDRANNAATMAYLVGLKAQNPSRLERIDFQRVAEEHGVEPWKLHGLTDIESRKGGFDNDGRAIMVPELHKFSEFTFRAYDESDPDLSIRNWIHPAKVKAGHPYTLDNPARWDVLARQAALDFDAALRAASWGAFQIMGFNYQALNFDTPLDLVRRVYEGERAQLDIAVRFLIAEGGFGPLLKGDFYRAAIVQNGTGKPREYAAEWKAASLKRRELYA